MHYADTYALIEILKGNPNYSNYTLLVTSEFNLLELAYALRRDHPRSKALNILETVRNDILIVQPTDEDYIKAAEFKMEQKKKGRNVSLIDALGYVLAQRLRVPFLTGDPEFEDIENVEYVK